MRVFLYECISAGGLGPMTPAALAHEGWAMLSAIVEDFQRLPNVETATLLDERLAQSLGDDCTQGRWQDEAAHFRAIAAACDCTLVIAPEFGDLLLDRTQAVLDVGSRLLGSLADAIRLTGDKLATAAQWHAAGVPHPMTEPADRHSVPSFDPPWVVKPRHGAGSEATVLTWSLPVAWPDWDYGEFVIQPFVRGDPVSVAFLIGATQRIPLMPARQHVMQRDGRLRYGGGSLPLPASLAERAVALAEQALAPISGLRGYVGVDLVIGDRDWAIEINPRLTTSYLGLRQLCQANLAELMLRLTNGEWLSKVTWSTGNVRFGN